MIDVHYIKANWVDLLSYSIIIIVILCCVNSLLNQALVFLDTTRGIVETVSIEYNETSVITNYEIMEQLKANFYLDGALFVLSFFFVGFCIIVIIGLSLVNEILRIVMGQRTEQEEFDELRYRFEQIEKKLGVKK